MGKDRGQISDDPVRFNPSYFEEDARTNKITTPDGEAVSIRAKAVRPDDVTAIGKMKMIVITITAAVHRGRMKDMTA